MLDRAQGVAGIRLPAAGRKWQSRLAMAVMTAELDEGQEEGRKNNAILCVKGKLVKEVATRSDAPERHNAVNKLMS